MDNQALDGLIKFRCTEEMESDFDLIAGRNRRKAADQARIVFEDFIAKDKRDNLEFWLRIAKQRTGEKSTGGSGFQDPSLNERGAGGTPATTPRGKVKYRIRKVEKAARPTRKGETTPG